MRRHTTHETTHSHSTSPVTRPRHRVHPVGARWSLATGGIVSSAAADDDDAGGRPGDRLQYRRLLGARVVTIYTFLRSARRMRVGEAAITWTRAVISSRVN